VFSLVRWKLINTESTVQIGRQQCKIDNRESTLLVSVSEREMVGNYENGISSDPAVTKATVRTEGGTISNTKVPATKDVHSCPCA
jgi:hypothetical protein